VIDVDKVVEHGELIQLEEDLRLACRCEDPEAAKCEVVANYFSQHTSRCALNIVKRYGFTTPEVKALAQDTPHWLGYSLA